MVSLPIRRIEARTFCHATEEEARVATALAFGCPEGDTSRESLEGYFGNRLVPLTRPGQKAAPLRTVWGRWTPGGPPPPVPKGVAGPGAQEGFMPSRAATKTACR